eukprot:TRINITY_DN8183_c0_g1_i5.p1 TRINITY_DN8183_c0_g1~~TRINITY_DN8183_c0_g1_i5.p1  ORF type:complete len:944 (+),score=150.79 TRINITY_DN8183_c0_g1_i5:57-2888(+)
MPIPVGYDKAPNELKMSSMSHYAPSDRTTSKDRHQERVDSKKRLGSKVALDARGHIVSETVAAQSLALDQFIPRPRRPSSYNLDSIETSALRATLAQRKQDEETAHFDPGKKSYCDRCGIVSFFTKFSVFESMSLRSIDFAELTAQKYGKGVSWQELPVVDQVDMVREALKARVYVIDPQSNYMKMWDIIVVLCLIFTALVTPYEIAFLKPGDSMAVTVLNRLVDITFVKDMIMQFFMKVERNTRQGKIWVRDRKQVAKIYARTWLFIDIIAIIPYDDITNNVSGEGVSRLKILRTIRVFRLFKLLRILKASRVVKRWENRISLRSTHVYLIKFTLLIVLCCHWMACVWGFVGLLDGTSLQCRSDLDPSDPRLQEEPNQKYFFFTQDAGANPFDPAAWEGDSWVVRFAAGRAANTSTDPCSPGIVYLAAIYWAVMTMTSVGYGDIIPYTVTEYIVCTASMMASSIVWAYIIGAACAVMSNMDPEQNEFERRLDDFNCMAKDQDLPLHIRYRGREYIREHRFHMHLLRNQHAWEALGSDLRGTVARQIASHYINNIWFFKGTSPQFREDVAKLFVANFYERREMIECPSRLCVVERGAVGRMGRILVPWGYWGEDMLIRMEILRQDHAAMTLTYSEIMTLHRDDLSHALSVHTIEAPRFRRAAALMALFRVAKIYGAELNSSSRSDQFSWIHGVFSSAAKLGDQHRKRQINSLVERIAENDQAPPPIGEVRATLEDKVDEIRKEMHARRPSVDLTEKHPPGQLDNQLLSAVMQKLESIEDRLQGLGASQNFKSNSSPAEARRKSPPPAFSPKAREDKPSAWLQEMREANSAAAQEILEPKMPMCPPEPEKDVDHYAAWDSRVDRHWRTEGQPQASPSQSKGFADGSQVQGMPMPSGDRGIMPVPACCMITFGERPQQIVQRFNALPARPDVKPSERQGLAHSYV